MAQGASRFCFHSARGHVVGMAVERSRYQTDKKNILHVQTI
jgi:hypothetical protein